MKSSFAVSSKVISYTGELGFFNVCDVDKFILRKIRSYNFVILCRSCSYVFKCGGAYIIMQRCVLCEFVSSCRMRLFSLLFCVFLQTKVAPLVSRPYKSQTGGPEPQPSTQVRITTPRPHG